MKRLAAARRVDPDGDLGARVEGVLELRELVEEAVGDPFGRILGDALEPDECRPYAFPDVLDGRRVAPRLVPVEPSAPSERHHMRSRSAATGVGSGGVSAGSPPAGVRPLISSSAPWT